MIPLNKLIALFFVIVTLISCKTVEIKPEPITGNLPERPERLNSEITIPFEMDIQAINEYMNQKLPSGMIANGKGESGNTTKYSYEVYRNKPVVFNAVGNELIFKVPIDIKAKGSYTTCIGFWRNGRCCSTPNPFGSGCATSGIRQTENGNASPTVDVELRVKLAIQEDYTVKAETYLKGYLSGDPHLHIDLIGNLIRININIKDKLEGPLQKFVADYQKEIDKKVADLVQQYNIKNEVNKYWVYAGQPVQLGDFWLKSEPQKVIFENLNAQNNKLRVGLGIASILEITSLKPQDSSTPLPNLSLQNNMEGLFNIHLPANATFSSLEGILKKEIVGKQYDKDGVKIKLNSISLQGVKLSESSVLLIKANVKGKAKSKRFKGDVYFTALPAIDDTNKVVYIEDFKLEPNTSSYLINKGLPFLIDNFYYTDLKQKLRYSYQKDYSKYYDLINEKLKNIQLSNLIINGNLEQIKIPGFYIDKESLDLLLVANGKLNTTVKLEQ
ncbi:DUF4403 family protein [Chryseobacterium daeguense]|uniref:DUF4403 family protein n=1 Tax=Chryseobacterium daeguense TaxID=412438 RepID=UPI00040E87D4|nr:DUF4403 family protein [Chryseobacterium daeguense]